MPTPTLFEITQSVIAILVTLGAGGLFATGLMTGEALTMIVGTVLGFYFGATRSAREADAIARAVLDENNRRIVAREERNP